MEVIRGPDGIVRCEWGLSADEMGPYHDNEWGMPIGDDRTLYEKLCLEGFQSGLAWITILRKRDNFRRAFHNFEPSLVAAMTEPDIERLLGDESIIRNRRKIESTINNARRTLELQETQSLGSLIWSFEPSDPERLAVTTDASVALAKALKKRGFTWVGPTTVQAMMQAMGVIKDHLDGCAVREKVEDARAAFEPPTT